MEEKEKKEKKIKDKSMQKKEGKLITKESICATLAMFLLMVFLVLCTRSLIFGELGETICAVLMGAFGYYIFPIVLGGIYLSVMGLFGKRLVDRKSVV